MKQKKKSSLLVKIAIGFVLGIIAGVVLGEKAAIFAPIGDLFLKLLQMLILPLVFCAIVSGLTNIPDIKHIYKIGVKSLVLFVVMTAFAIATGMIFGNVFKPGANSTLSLPTDKVEDVGPVSFIDTLLNMVPSNVFAAFSDNMMLQVIVFAFFVGVCILLLGNKLTVAKKVFDDGAAIMYKMTDIVIGFAPFGVFGLIAGVIGKQGIASLLPLGKFILVFHLAIIFFVFVVQGLLIYLGARMNPLKFFKGIFQAISIAFVTDSSAAALPIAMKELQSNLKVPESITSFVMPVGTNVSKSGSALYQGITVIFIAQVLGMNLSLTTQFTVFVTALLASLGTAGVPSASLVMLSMTLTAAGLPLEGIALMAGIDRILGGARTTPNVITNAAVSKIVAPRPPKKKDINISDNIA